MTEFLQYVNAAALALVGIALTVFLARLAARADVLQLENAQLREEVTALRRDHGELNGLLNRWLDDEREIEGL